MASHVVGYPHFGDLEKLAADLRKSNYHFIGPEWGPDVKFSYASHKAVTEYKDAKALDTVTVLFGPVSYLLLSKPAKGVEESFSLLSLLGKILPIYKEVITELKEAGASWIQFDEPTLVMDLESHKLHAFTEAYSALESTLSGLNVLIETCFADIPAEQYKTLTSLKGVTAFGCDVVRGTKILDLIKPDKEIKPWLGFALQKVVEVNALGSALAGQKDEVIFSANAAALAPRKPSPRVTYEAVQKADAALKGSDHRRATNIHTHTFHSNFNDTVHSIIDMDDPWPMLTQGLIPAQMKEKWDKGLCFKCDHKWGPGQRCGGPKLFRIEETKGDRDPIDNTEDYLRYLPIISLNEEIGISPPAINRSPKPMMVKIMVNSHEYIALIDTGSNLNFLHPRVVAQEARLNIIKDDPIEVSIADGSTMCSEGSCPEFEFVIQGGQFATQAYILPVDGCDVILGIQWLMGLGQINWDFASLKMEFTQGDNTILIKGMDTEESEAGCSTDEKLLTLVREGVKYGAGIGPGVYDIHSPRVPSTEEIADGINKMLETILWVNPDSGLKTRKYTGVKPSLKNKLLRSQLASAK